MVEEVVVGIKMSINVPIKVRIEMTKKFEWAYKKSIEASVKHITRTIKNEMPSASGKTKTALDYDIDYDKGEARIGWKSGTRDELVGSVLQYGSGQRGRNEYQTSRFGEQKPNYTVPIVPIRAKVMSFIGRDGKRKYMKSFIGHPPKYILTRGLLNSMKFLPIVFDNQMNK